MKYLFVLLSFAPLFSTASLLTKEQSQALLSACSVFQSAEACFKENDHWLGYEYCGLKWKYDVRVMEQHLIRVGFMGEARLRIYKEDYQAQHEACKEAHQGHDYLSFKTYKCFRPINFEYWTGLIEGVLACR